MDDLKEKIYLLALDMIKNREATFICKALEKSYKQYIGAEEELSDEELKELFSEFFDLYDGTYWYYSENEFISSTDQRKIHGCWWSPKAVEPRKRMLELILSSRCR